VSGNPFDDWIGRTEFATDIAAREPLKRLAALLDHESPPWPEEEVPPLAHWLYFLPRAPQSAIGPDGHPLRGDFLPPIPLPRRMWAGSRVAFQKPLTVGAAILRRSTIADIREKQGAGGQMAFVTIRHEISGESGPAIVEEQDIVFRDAAPNVAGKSTMELSVPELTRDIALDSSALFRFSALTFNAHRIHYDRDYARDIEFYPGLVVQGPFTAVLLLDLFLQNHSGARLSHMAVRALRPLFDGAPIRLCLARDGARVKLWALDPTGRAAMTAELTLETGKPT
jgi:3-methylfumaryl-CoA hydratase